MTIATLHLWHTLTEVLQKSALFLLKTLTHKNGTQYKCDFTKITSHKLHCCQEFGSSPE